MADFEKKVSLIEVDVDVTGAKKDVDSLTLSIIEQKDAVKANTAQIKALEDENKNLQKEVKKGNVTQKEANETLVNNSKNIKDLKLQNASLNDGIKDLNKERRNAVKVTKLQANTLNALKKESIDLTDKLGNQEKATEAGARAFDKIQKELKETNEQIKELDQGSGNFKSSIGDYPDILDSMSGGLDAISGGSASAAQGFLSMTKQALAFIATPVGAILAAIVAVFLLVNNAMSKNEEAGDKVKKIFTVLGSVFQAVLDALTPLGEFLIDQLVVGFQLAGEAAEKAMSLISDGLEFLGFDEAAKSVEEFTENLSKVVEVSTGIFDLERSVRALNRELTVTNEELQGQAELYDQLANDATLSFEEQQKAAVKVQQVQQELFSNRVKQAKAEEELISKRIQQVELEGGAVRDLLDEQADASAARIAIESEYTTFLAQNAELRRKLAQDVWEQDLDFAIDVGTRRTEEALRASEDEKKSLEARQSALADARALDEEAFNNQLNLFEQIGLSRQKINDLVNESNASVIASELKKD